MLDAPRCERWRSNATWMSRTGRCLGLTVDALTVWGLLEYVCVFLLCLGWHDEQFQFQVDQQVHGASQFTWLKHLVFVFSPMSKPSSYMYHASVRKAQLLRDESTADQQIRSDFWGISSEAQGIIQHSQPAFEQREAIKSAGAKDGSVD